MPYLSYNKNLIVTGISNRPFVLGDDAVIFTSKSEKWDTIVGQKLPRGINMSSPVKSINELRVAVVCNWNDRCGISTYSKYLVTALQKQVKELQIFSEFCPLPTAEDEPNVIRCWQRGDSLRVLATKLLAWEPDLVLIQHEYGIFPNATHFTKFMHMLEKVPYLLTLHSVYEHLDKAVYCSVIKNILVHSEAGKETLIKTGNTSNVFVIPHGCVVFDDVKELWNIFQNPYIILQFGFGFKYKGTERALEAIAHLKNTDPKYKDIFYCLLMSENPHNNRVHEEYYQHLMQKIDQYDIRDNVAIIRKWQSDMMLNNFLRIFKLAVFPYVNNTDNVVYAASGAARVAIANGIPVVVSESHLFDDFEGILPRPNDAISLAKEIDKIFSDSKYRASILKKSGEYIQAYTWDEVARMYLDLYPKLVS